jgi:hypothetical protein
VFLTDKLGLPYGWVSLELLKGVCEPGCFRELSGAEASRISASLFEDFDVDCAKEWVPRLR